MTQVTADETTLAHLTRLSQKPGVQSTLVLDRSTGSIVRSTGLLSAPTPNLTSSASSNPLSTSATPLKSQSGSSRTGHTAEEVATLAWNFVKGAEGLVEGMAESDAEGPDELKLLRVRTKRFECVIVPDSKFLLVVIHDTPAA
ncbi:MAG: hypothetical protein M1824_005742 [Vezdaea acicularis]|nr:MAG: hypothetical protein M1824_005742 [Vezdaea acicularis]